MGTKECAIRSHIESLGWSSRDIEDLEDIKVITYGPCSSNQTNHTSKMFECVNTTGCNLIKLIIHEYISGSNISISISVSISLSVLLVHKLKSNQANHTYATRYNLILTCVLVLLMRFNMSLIRTISEWWHTWNEEIYKFRIIMKFLEWIIFHVEKRIWTNSKTRILCAEEVWTASNCWTLGSNPSEKQTWFRPHALPVSP